MVHNDTCLATDVKINAGFERYLNYGGKFCELFCSPILNVG